MSRFWRERGGNVAIIFALASLPMLALTGAAIDYGLATRQQVKLQAATDATSLALCQTPLATPQSSLYTQAVVLENGYMGTSGMTVDQPVLVAGTQTTPRKITLTAHMNSATKFSPFTKLTTPVTNATAQCTTPLPKTFEIALVLDNTGSMSETSDGITKMAALQQAANNFIAYVQKSPAFAADTRISIVPFSGAVALNPNDASNNYRTASWMDTKGKSDYSWANIDKYQANQAGFTSRFDIFTQLKKLNTSWDWAGCVETLPYPQNVQDGAPSISGTANGGTEAQYNTLYVPLLAPDEPEDANNNSAWVRWNLSSYYDWNSYTTDGSANSWMSCYDSNNSGTSSTQFFGAESHGCKYSYATSGSSRSSSSYYGFDLGQNGPNFSCTSKPLQRLTNNYTTLTTLINAMTARGSTNIHEGVMWGWRTLSPTSVFADGVPYATSSVSKIMIVMTDGMNDWLPTYNGYANPNGTIYDSIGYLNNAGMNNGVAVTGTLANYIATANSRLPPDHQNPTVSISNIYDTSATSGRSARDALTSTACANAKAAGISIYSIAFSVSSDPIDAKGQSVVQGCASSPSQYYLANDSNGVLAAFAQIAGSIGALRLSM